MGLGGAIYFVFFTVPVLVGSLIYEYSLGTMLRKRKVSVEQRLWLSVYGPFLLIGLLLMIFCPMDGSRLYLKALYEAIIERLF